MAVFDVFDLLVSDYHFVAGNVLRDDAIKFKVELADKSHGVTSRAL